LAWEAAVLLAGAGAPSAAAQKMLAPSINIKQACSPDRLPGTAPIGIRVTGLALCMKNTASDALLAVSGAVSPAFQL
jgi:hypothetical protein